MSNYQELSAFLSQHDLQEKAVREKFSDLIRRVGKKDLIDTDAFYEELSKRIKPAKRPRKKVWDLANAGLIKYHLKRAEKRLAKIKTEIGRTSDSEHNKLVKLHAIESDIQSSIERMKHRLEDIKQANMDKLREFNDPDKKK